MNFKIEKSELTGCKGCLFLKSDDGHCHLPSSVDKLLRAEVFRDNNPSLVPIFEKAQEMMARGETGQVIVEQ